MVRYVQNNNIIDHEPPQRYKAPRVVAGMAPKQCETAGGAQQGILDLGKIEDLNGVEVQFLRSELAKLTIPPGFRVVFYY